MNSSIPNAAPISCPPSPRSHRRLLSVFHLLVPAASVLILLTGCSSSAYEPATATAIPEAVRSTVRDAVDREHRTSVMVALINPTGVHTFAYPSVSEPVGAAGSAGEVGPSSVFAVGSVTKIFTALLLADMVERGELELESPVNRYLPDDLQIPRRGGVELTLLHLATHTSGLPKEPEEWDWTAPETPDEIVRFVQDFDVSEPYGTRYAYSNLGMALLGRVMELRAQQPLPQLLQERVTGPLGLSDTGYSLDADQRRRVVRPHLGTEALDPESLAVAEAAYAASGLFSTPEDLLDFLSVQIAPASSPLGKAVERTHRTYAVTDEPNLHMGLGWKIYQGDGFRVIHHGGQSSGHQGFLGFVPGQSVAVLLLAGSRSDDELDRVALHLLRPKEIPLPDFSFPREIRLPPEVLAGYRGRYRVDGDNAIEIEVRDGRLLYRETTPAGELVRETTIYASSETEFYFTDIPVRLEFHPQGERSSSLTLYLPGDRALSAERRE